MDENRLVEVTTEITPTNTVASYNFRCTIADLQAVAAWQTDLNSRLPAGSSFKIEPAYNGNGILEVIQSELLIDIDTESHVPVEFIKPAGAAADVRWPTTFSTAWSDTDLRKDPLYSAMKTSFLATGAFTYASHTFTHENLDNTSYSDVINELSVNYKMAGSSFLGLQGKSYWNNKTMVTPQISGMHNEYALKALKDFGIVGIVGDNSRPLLTPANPFEFWITTLDSSNYAGYTVIPRWPCHVYYFVTLPSEIEYIYNIMYNQTLGMSTWDQILDREGARQLQLFLSIRHDPVMFHQANLRTVDMPTVTVGGKTGQLGVLAQWTEKVLSVYLALVDWPVVSLKGDDLYDLYAERMTRTACGVSTSYDLVNNADGTSSIQKIYITSTGTCKARITVPASVVVAAGQTIEKIGNDFANHIVHHVSHHVHNHRDAHYDYLGNYHKNIKHYFSVDDEDRNYDKNYISNHYEERNYHQNHFSHDYKERYNN
ncbi:hypothetical protein HDU93_003735 [Gonapodya sp. JEL0774]|nr:hypothetical protein HDU93_003735 [Gonapodya sp. JEL0774]